MQIRARIVHEIAQDAAAGAVLTRVGQRMTQPVITIQGNLPILDPPGLMRQEHKRGFHAVDEK
jgi:signal-transduction protein with cAMP-binding, CBS, and nucleotidyltransferase domain